METNKKLDKSGKINTNERDFSPVKKPFTSLKDIEPLIDKIFEYVSPESDLKIIIMCADDERIMTAVGGSSFDLMKLMTSAGKGKKVVGDAITMAASLLKLVNREDE